MRVLIVTSRDSGGGAPRAIHRIFQSLQAFCAAEADTFLRVVHKSFDDNRILGGKPMRNLREQVEYLFRTRFRKYFPNAPFNSPNKVLHSQALYDTGLGREINAYRPDVVLLGWLGSSTLSIREIGRLKAPIVWRLSDMWMFSGAEHYSYSARFERGYSRDSRPRSETGPDINRKTFLRKRKQWKKPQHIICPSSWMAEQVKKSTLTAGWPVHVVPNALDLDAWHPRDQIESRERLRLNRRTKLILFGAGSGLKDHHKGGDLFLSALEALSDIIAGTSLSAEAVVFGQSGKPFRAGSIGVRPIGRLDDNQLKDAYSAANVMVVPSRVDNFPSTAVEAHACGTPVVGFKAGGLPDIVSDGESGRLVTPFDTKELASALAQILTDPVLEKSFGSSARARAEKLWSPQNVATRYLDVLKMAASEKPPASDSPNPNG